MRAMMRKLGTYALVSTLILWASPGVAASLCLVITGHTTSHEHAEHAHHSPHSDSDGFQGKNPTRDHARTEIDVCCSKVFQRGAGAVIVADTNPQALEQAVVLGVDETVLVEEGASVGRQVKLLSDGGVDAAIEFVGAAAAVDAAVKSIRPGGRAVAVGVGLEPVVSLPVVLWSNHEYVLMGSYGSLPGDTHRVLEALSAGTVVSPRTVDVPLTGGPALFESLVAGQPQVPGRPIIRP